MRHGNVSEKSLKISQRMELLIKSRICILTDYFDLNIWISFAKLDDIKLFSLEFGEIFGMNRLAYDK